MQTLALTKEQVKLSTHGGQLCSGLLNFWLNQLANYKLRIVEASLRLLFLDIVAKTTCELQAKKCINITATAFSLYGG